jgi:hypothetical protein
VSPPRTLYDVLGVAPEASDDDVRRAHHDLVRALHPDRHHGRSPDPRRLHEVNEAWRVLRDPATRRAYDDSIRQEAARVDAAPAPPDVPDLDEPYRGRPVEPGDIGISIVRGLPWVAVVVVLVVIFVFTAFAGGGGSGRSGARDLAGRCVERTSGSGIRVVPCDGPSDGRVLLVVDRPTLCPDGTSPVARSGQWLCLDPDVGPGAGGP